MHTGAGAQEIESDGEVGTYRQVANCVVRTSRFIAGVNDTLAVGPNSEALFATASFPKVTHTIAGSYTTVV